MIVCSATAKMYLWRSLKEAQLVSFLTFFSPPIYRHDQVWVSFYLSSWCGLRWVHMCVSQDVTQSLVTTIGVFVSLSKLLPLAAGAFLNKRGHWENQHKAQSGSCITSGGHREVIQVWSSGKQTPKSFIGTAVFLVGNKYSTNLPSAIIF